MRGMRTQHALSLVLTTAPVALQGAKLMRAAPLFISGLNCHFFGRRLDLRSAMDWSSIQGSILTGGGRLEELYQPPLFPWRPDELPHYHKVRMKLWRGRCITASWRRAPNLRALILSILQVNRTTEKQFDAWKAAGARSELVAGAWSRELFVGGWHHTVQHDRQFIEDFNKLA